jgi:glycogen debranching enzyme
MPDTAEGQVEIGAATSEFGIAPIAQFYIEAAASLEERRPRTLKHGDTFGVFDHSGNVLSGSGSAEGLYHRDTRHLSHLALSIDGMRPLLLSSNLREDNATLTCDLSNPDLRRGDRVVLNQDLIHLRCSKYLWQGACYERIAVRNYDDRRHRVTLTIEFVADFADLFEVRGLRRKRRGTISPPIAGPDCVTLSYDGLDGRRRQTRLRFDPVPARVEADRAEFELELPPGGRAVVFVDIRCEGQTEERAPREVFLASMRDARRALRASSSRAASVETSNEIFNEAVRRCVSDLYMLITDQPEGPYPYAGIPWFSTVFGRDALITALYTLWMDPSIARGVLAYLAANQATYHDRAADAEPGKILHEVRQGEVALLGEVPFRRYYGSVDATPLFLILAGAYLERTGDGAFLRTLWPAIEAALRWIDADGDRDGDGFVEYGRRADEGLVNQGWKDSQDSIFHADGKLARGPIAPVEVQAYVYAAKRAAATIARCFEFHEQAAGLEIQAETLRQRFEAAFWDEQLGTYVLALDGDKRPCRVSSSNAGHALFSGIAVPARATRVARSLMGAAQFSGWGIRTVGSSEARYNPMSYHNGSVWPHDNALIALGFAAYGFGRQAARIFEGLFDASTHMDLRRLPELFCGFARQRGQGPTAYPVACSPQAWAATAPLALLQACLGLGFDLATRSIIFKRPELPGFLNQVILRGLSLGEARLDVMLRRAGAEVAVNVLSRRGDIRVITVS